MSVSSLGRVHLPVVKSVEYFTTIGTGVERPVFGCSRFAFQIRGVGGLLTDYTYRIEYSLDGVTWESGLNSRPPTEGFVRQATLYRACAKVRAVLSTALVLGAASACEFTWMGVRSG